MSESNFDSTIHIVSKDETCITVPTDAPFGTLRFRFEENGKIIEVPIVPRMLHDMFVKDLYIHKDLIKS